MVRGKGLLDVLTHQVGAGYISDLPKGEYREALVKAINNLKSTDYPINQWLDVIDYLLGQKQDIKDVEECKKLLLKLL